MGASHEVKSVNISVDERSQKRLISKLWSNVYGVIHSVTAPQAYQGHFR